MESSQNLPYPEHWEADVVLRDGRAAHIRPIVPEDASRLEELHLRLSPETIYYRYFTARPRLTARDLRYLTQVDYRDRVAFVATMGDELIGVARYDRLDRGHDDLSVAEGAIAEVAFVGRDDQQGRGIASVLLEHLAAAAREREVARFAAEILPENRRMIAMFNDAGYRTVPSSGEGVVRLVSDLEHTETSLSVMRAREHRAESRSIERLLHPGAVAVIGVGRVEGLGRTVLRHIREGGYVGAVSAVTPDADPAGSEIGGVPAYASITDIPGPVDVAVVAVPAPEVLGVARDCGTKGVHGLVVVSSGFADEDSDGAERQVELVRIARGDGMRVVGPNCLGVIVTDPGACVNATYVRQHVRREACGMFSQSSVFGVALLEAAGRRGVGLSSFVSAGNSADVSANDLLQYWEDDPNTAVVLMYLESTGNPRKFTRLARRISRSKPIVAVRSGRFGRIEPPGQAPGRSTLPPPAGDALFAQAGVVQVDSIAELLDVGALLVRQPLPRGNRAAVVGNSDSLCFLAYDVGLRYGLRMHEPANLGERATADRLRNALVELLNDDTVDAVVTVLNPLLSGTGTAEKTAETLAELTAETLAETLRGVVGAAVAQVAGRHPRVGPKTLLAAVVGYDQARAEATMPIYPVLVDAMRALAHVVRYATRLQREPGLIPELAQVRTEVALALVKNVLSQSPTGYELDAAQLTALLECYGVRLWPTRRVASREEAVAAAEEFGYPVALKMRAEPVRRADLGGVRLGIGSAEDLAAAFTTLAGRLNRSSRAEFVVQPMAPPGPAVVVRALEDSSFGDVISFGLDGVATELLDDTAFRILPLTDVDAAELVRSVKAAPLLFGHRGAEPADVAALEDLLLRVSRLAEDLPQVAELELRPVVVGSSGVSVLHARAHITPPPVVADLGPRRLG